jgi:hypothetical protein
VPDVNVRVEDFWLEDGEGNRVENAEQKQPLRLNLVAEARHDLTRPVFNFHVLNADGYWVFGFSKAVEGRDGSERIAAGQRIRISGDVENPLLPGRYSVECWVSRDRDEGNVALHVLRLANFLVYGTERGAGNVVVPVEIEALVESRDGK